MVPARTPDLGGWTRYHDPDRSLPQRANLLADLANALPSHVGYFRASDAGPVEGQNGDTHSQEFGIATFVHQRHTVLTETARFVHGAFAEHASWPRGGRPRRHQNLPVHQAQPPRQLHAGIREAVIAFTAAPEPEVSDHPILTLDV